MSIGANFDTEARVTREVAEAVLPYLMEAAGIPGDPHSGTTKKANVWEYESIKIQSILSMIFTDEGQQQMVKWVKTGKFPDILKSKFNEQNTYHNKYYRNCSLAALFPCQTDTFTSFANHDTRLGKHILKKAVGVHEQIQSLLGIKCYQKFEDILHHIDSEKHIKSNDILLAKIIFIIDTCDNLKQLTDSLNININEPQQTESEYVCRPVSAIVAKKLSDPKPMELDGDCVETLYKHLIHIAIQDKDKNHIFHAEQLPDKLYKYHVSNFTPEEAKSCVNITTVSEAGTTNIERHNTWKQYLKEHVKEENISFGSLNNIAKVLAKVADIEADENDLQTIKNSLNKLAIGKTFEVAFADSFQAPIWCDRLIRITEKIDGHTTRKIDVGICTIQDRNKGHAEILQIKSIKQ